VLHKKIKIDLGTSTEARWLKMALQVLGGSEPIGLDCIFIIDRRQQDRYILF
jgi:hypothetical protein